jgi:hypothetical protein
MRKRAAQRIVSAARPDVSRLSARDDRGVGACRQRIDRSEEFKLDNTMEECAPMLNGREKLISMAVEPWYMRLVYLPNRV